MAEHGFEPHSPESQSIILATTPHWESYIHLCVCTCVCTYMHIVYIPDMASLQLWHFIQLKNIDGQFSALLPLLGAPRKRFKAKGILQEPLWYFLAVSALMFSLMKNYMGLKGSLLSNKDIAHPCFCTVTTTSENHWPSPHFEVHATLSLSFEPHLPLAEITVLSVLRWGISHFFTTQHLNLLQMDTTGQEDY